MAAGGGIWGSGTLLGGGKVAASTRFNRLLQDSAHSADSTHPALFNRFRAVRQDPMTSATFDRFCNLQRVLHILHGSADSAGFNHSCLRQHFLLDSAQFCRLCTFSRIQRDSVIFCTFSKILHIQQDSAHSTRFNTVSRRFAAIRGVSRRFAIPLKNWATAGDA